MASLALSDRMINIVARRFHTLGEPYRLRLLQALEAGEMTVGELVQALDGNQPNVSKHLRILHDIGLVSRRREATSIFYAISDPMVLQLCELVCRSAEQQSRQQLDELQPIARPSARRKK